MTCTGSLPRGRPAWRPVLKALKNGAVASCDSGEIQPIVRSAAMTCRVDSPKGTAKAEARTLRRFIRSPRRPAPVPIAAVYRAQGLREALSHLHQPGLGQEKAPALRRGHQVARD